MKKSSNYPVPPFLDAPRSRRGSGLLCVAVAMLLSGPASPAWGQGLPGPTPSRPAVSAGGAGAASRVTDAGPRGSSRMEQPGRGGFWPFVQSCLCGPRIGLEANEGRPATALEYINFFVRVIVPVKALRKNGMRGCCASCCIGPRVGMQLDERRIRTLEWFRVIPILGVYASIVSGFEASEGRTMSEIVEAESMQR